MRPTLAIMFGVAIAASKLISPFWIWATSSSEPMMSAPAASASRAFSPRRRRQHEWSCRCVGQGDGAADVLVGLTSIDAQTEVGLDGLVELGGVELLDELGSLKGGVERGAVDLLGSGVIALTMLSHVHYLLWLNGRELPHRIVCPIAHI